MFSICMHITSLLSDLVNPPTYLAVHSDIVLETLFPTGAFLVDIDNIIQLSWKRSIVLHVAQTA